jgi:ABC-type phosphate/phosphonate transport system substrate-binding protein
MIKDSMEDRQVKRLSVCLLLLCAAVAGISNASDKMPEKVIFALKPDKNPEQMLKEKQALEVFLSAKLGTKVEAIIPLSSAVILEGFTNGTVDLGYLSSTDLVKARSTKAADLLLVGEIEGKTWYQSYWLTLKDKPYSSVQDLKGKPHRHRDSSFPFGIWSSRAWLRKAESPRTSLAKEKFSLAPATSPR